MNKSWFVKSAFLVMGLLVGCSSASESQTNNDVVELPSVSGGLQDAEFKVTACEWFDGLGGFVVGTVEKYELVEKDFYFEQSSEKLAVCDGIIEPALKITVRVDDVVKGDLEKGKVYDVFVGWSQLSQWSPGFDYSEKDSWFWADKTRGVSVGQKLVLPVYWVADRSEWTIGGEAVFSVNGEGKLQAQDREHVLVRELSKEMLLENAKVVLGKCEQGTEKGKKLHADTLRFLNDNTTYVSGAMCFEKTVGSGGGKCVFDNDCVEGEEECRDGVCAKI